MLQRLVSLAAILLGARLLLGADSAAPLQPAPPAAAPAILHNSDLAGNPQDARNTKPQYWYGVAVEKISPSIARQLKLHPDQGLMVLAILPDSPAAKAGLQPDDLLVELNGKPLVSQANLAVACGSIVPDKSGRIAPSSFVFLRDGDRKTAQIVPAPRPEQMLVIGGNASNFSGNNAPGDKNAGANSQAPSPENFTNYIAPNGNSLLVGPGYQIDLQSQSAGTVNIRRALANGQRVIINQETDPAGKIRITITQGPHTYPIEPGHLDALPENIRGLAQQTLAESGAPAAPPTPEDLARQLADLQAHIKDLQTQINQLRDNPPKQLPTKANTSN
jgi:membrane-associated protease RseP (regulator of RpoE activity)